MNLPQTFLFLNWKDMGHPGAGGAEVVHDELIKRLIKAGHKVTLLTSNYQRDKVWVKDCETVDGLEIIRVGKNRYLHVFQATWYYVKSLRNKYNFVISCNNTAPYFVGCFKGNEKHFSFYHQLAREVWFFETNFFLAWLGYLFLEPVSLFIQAVFNPKVITISNSTKHDLIRFGFKEKNISIISEGVDIESVQNLGELNKFENLTILSFGAMREMKRTLDIVKGFEVLKDRAEVSDTKLVIAGSTSGEYAKKVLEYIENSKYRNDISVLGKVTQEKKIELMQRSHLIAVTSIKEGWGLIVTEANSQGTPAVVYNVDGLRDSVQNNLSGLVTETNTPEGLAVKMQELLTAYCENNGTKYKAMQKFANDWSKTINFEQSYIDFCKICNI